MTENETLREMLTERGVDWEAFDRFEQTTQWSTYNGAFVYWSRERDGKLLVETTAPTKCSASCTPAQAIAATVGGTVWEPSKEWKAWHESLKHDNPTNIREAVENILFDAIDFGGDMGPNGNVWSGVDEGDVLTKKCIDGWVRSIESVAVTVGVDSNTGEAIRNLLDKLNTELCNAGCVIECETREERQRLIEATKDRYAQAIAATVGAEKLDTSELWPEWEQVLFANVTDVVAQDNLNECVHELLEKAATVGGTCRLVDNESGLNMHCTACGREVDDEYRYFTERWGYSRCPHCGRQIEVAE